VKDYLVVEYDFITEQMIEAKGYGEKQPLESNNTPENKQLNRHIEVLVWE
jgi:outer membrane protein OmpA-like peptidoglycan-associated protein